MAKNSFIIALRVVIKQKVSSLIKIGGLAVGFTCCLLIVTYIQFEWSFDRYHKKAEHIYRVVQDVKLPSGTTATAFAPGPVGPALTQDFPEVLRMVRLCSATMLVEYNGKRFQEDNIYFTDSTVFDVFSFRIKEGDPQTALAKPFSVVVTQGTAIRYFGDADPIGQILTIDGEFPFTVTGVVENVPINSHLHFDMLMSMSTREAASPGWLDGWSWSAYTYVQLAPGTDPSNLAEKLPAFLARRAEKNTPGSNEWSLSLQPLRELHLYSTRSGEPGAPGNVSNLYLFGIVAVFIILIACINFVNLTTAHAGRRIREVGVRKAIGGTRLQLASQFLAESVTLSFSAALVSYGLAQMVLPSFRNLVGVPVTQDFLSNIWTILMFMVISLCIGCLAGAYPALTLSAFRPVTALKGLYKASPGRNFLREGLIIFQFTISMALIACTIIVFSQLRYMQNKDVGYDKEQVLVLYFGDDQNVQSHVEAIKQELLRNRYLSSAATSSHVPGKEPGRVRAEMTTPEGTTVANDVGLIAVDYDFVNLYAIPLAAGRAFSPRYADSTQSLMVNEATVRQFGFSQPDDILGKQLTQRGQTGTVVGVTKDFNFASLHKQIEPMVIRMRTKSLSYFSLKIRPDNLSLMMNDLNKRWVALAPHRPFDYFFLDEQLDRQYRADTRFGKAFGVASIVSIMLACLGLFGLVAFTVEQRTKEIGIRKVLGASVAGVVAMISMNFIRLVLVASLIAIPIAWYLMRQWLQDFAYRITAQWWMFVLAGSATLLIAMLTVSFQSIRAARVNPVNSLRSE